MPFHTVNDVRYRYELTGPTGSTPLVLLHGFTGSATNWQPIAPALAEERRVLAIDLLGHGKTDTADNPARYAMPAAARDLIELWAALLGEPVHLLGYSMGGRLALYTALHFGDAVRSLVLESASPGLRTEAERVVRRQRDEALAKRIERDGVEAFVDFWESIPLFATQERLDAATKSRLRTQRLANRALGLANSLRGMGTGAQPSLWGNLDAWSKPTLLLTGAQDKKFCNIADAMQESLPSAERITVADAGHTVHLEQPSRFVQAITSFLRGQ